MLNRDKSKLEYEFLPQALEIIETPASPVGRFIIWFIFIALTLVVVWSYFSKVDVVVTSRGQIITEGKIKTIQARNIGAIKNINVNEGQNVKKGDILIELDATNQKVDVDVLRKTIEINKLEKAILKAELEGEVINKIIEKSHLPEDVKQTQAKLKQVRDEEYKAKQELAKLNIEQAETELKIAENELSIVDLEVNELTHQLEVKTSLSEDKTTEEMVLEKLNTQIEILKEKKIKLNELYENDAISKEELDEVSNQINLLEQDYKLKQKQDTTQTKMDDANLSSLSKQIQMAKKRYTTQLQKINKLKLEIEQQKKSLENFEKERESQIVKLLAEKEKELQEQSAILLKAEKSLEEQIIKSPIDGQILSIQKNTIGGTVNTQEELVTIVPNNMPLIVEAYVTNKDIGHIKLNNLVEIKIDTYPFQKYGTLQGKITHISPDAFRHDKLGTVFKVKIKLEDKTTTLSKTPIAITPGMTVMAEIKVGKRRIIDFFLEPIMKYKDESLKVR